MAHQKPTRAAIAILALIGIATFLVCNAVVSSASTRSPSSRGTFTYPFSAFSFTGNVVSSSSSAFTLQFLSSFTLSPKSPGLVTGNTLDNVSIQEAVA
jgi:hypothetical protein